MTRGDIVPCISWNWHHGTSATLGINMLREVSSNTGNTAVRR